MMCMLSHWTKAFCYRQAKPASVAEILLQKIVAVEALLNFIVIWESILLDMCFEKSVLPGQFYSTFIVYTIFIPQG